MSITAYVTPECDQAAGTLDPRIARFLALPARDRAAMIAALEAFAAEREQQAAATREHIAALRAAAPTAPAISAAA